MYVCVCVSVCVLCYVMYVNLAHEISHMSSDLKNSKTRNML